MCGFIGIISKQDKPFELNKLKEMSQLIQHRGPDDEGHYQHQDWLSLAFRRLSILDLSPQGHQPMLSADKAFVIVFNGEVYNYLELRAELEKEGYQFHSGTDTEVVLAAYRHWGQACVDRFIGMFAFMVVNLETRETFIARDPLGIKPLFYYEDGDYLFFCSEVKTLLPYCQLELNPDSVHEYLVFRSVIGAKSMFKGVSNLRPGHCLHYRDGQLHERAYFSLADQLQPDDSRSFEETCEEVESTFIDSVKLHLRSDVELGVQLSGGVDSSLITAIASKESGKRFHTFSISFAESFYDESKYQKMVSERYGTEHHDYPMDNARFTELYPRAVWHYEHPLNDPNSVATYYLTQKAKQHITVMLSGEGADESFLGYTRFKQDSLRRLRQRTWLYQHPALREMLFRLWPINKGKALFNITRYCPSMYVLSYADLNDIDRLLHGNDDSIAFRKHVSASAKGNVLDEAMLQDQICDLLQWFWRADRMGMASAMELRVPFCTVPMFKLANSIPYEQRVYRGERKAVLKKIAENYIDHEQIYRKKIGFGTPIDDWVNQEGPYKTLFDETMESTAFRERDFIDHAHISDLYQRHKSGDYREINSAFLWTYFNLETWYKIYFEGGWRKLV